MQCQQLLGLHSALDQLLQPADLLLGLLHFRRPLRYRLLSPPRLAETCQRFLESGQQHLKRLRVSVNSQTVYRVKARCKVTVDHIAD